MPSLNTVTRLGSRSVQVPRVSVGGMRKGSPPSSPCLLGLMLQKWLLYTLLSCCPLLWQGCHQPLWGFLTLGHLRRHGSFPPEDRVMWMTEEALEGGRIVSTGMRVFGYWQMGHSSSPI